MTQNLFNRQNSTLLMDFSKLQKKYDKQNMIQVLRSFPEQFEEAIKTGKNYDLPKRYLNRDFQNVLVQGMGGSGIGGILLKNLLGGTRKFPIEVNQNYGLPAFVDKNTLMFAVSYSGNTEETLSGFELAKKRKTTMIALTSGGTLARKSKNTILLPKGMPPRTQLAQTFIPMVVVLNKLGIVNRNKELSSTKKFLQKNIKKFEEEGKKLALHLNGKIPVIYSTKRFEGALVRFHTQIAENAKVFSHWNVIPELTHNEIVGFRPLENKLVFVFFREKEESKRNKKRFEVTKKIASKKSKVVEIYCSGTTRFEKLFSLIMIGDFCSYYLALLGKVDPWPVENIEFLKKELSKVK